MKNIVLLVFVPLVKGVNLIYLNIRLGTCLSVYSATIFT